MSHPSPLAAVIGDPIGHSRSPRLHGHWLRRHALAGHYVPLHIRTADLPAALAMLPKIGFVGANVTLPHKHTALALADVATPLARRIGAANTLTFTDNGLEADNTDAFGFSQNILSVVPQWTPRTVAVVGAGGAIRAVLAALLDLGTTTIRLTNRSPDRAKALSDEFGPVIMPTPWDERSEMLSDCDTLINGTSLGMVGQPLLDLDLSRLPHEAVVNDLVYTPLETRLLAQARARGNTCIDGLGMLLYQAAPGFARWFGTMPVVDADLRDAVLRP